MLQSTQDHKGSRYEPLVGARHGREETRTYIRHEGKGRRATASFNRVLFVRWGFTVVRKFMYAGGFSPLEASRRAKDRK